MSRYSGCVTDDHARVGRPRSEQARTAVLHAVDDLLVEVGYSALTMKGIAERAGVGRQTVYRWWSTKAEVLFEATIADAADELVPTPRSDALGDVTAYIDGVVAFLTASPAGAGYRALIGEAQHDTEVARLMSTVTLFDTAARTVLERLIARGDLSGSTPLATAVALLTGPAYFRVFDAPGTRAVDTASLAAAALATIGRLTA